MVSAMINAFRRGGCESLVVEYGTTSYDGMVMCTNERGKAKVCNDTVYSRALLQMTTSFNRCLSGELLH